MDSSASCPVCNQSFPPSLLHWHVDTHFDSEQEENLVVSNDEQLARDLELAEQLSLSHALLNQSLDQAEPLLIASQTRSSFHRVATDGGLMTLLYERLQSGGAKFNGQGKGKYAAAAPATTLLAGYVDHYQSRRGEDSGWGCGYRNIQMLASHLLNSRPDAREVLFGGSGFVPDIPFLQGWLEVAWRKGFDPLGSQQFHHSIRGSKRWIGTTECAALLRSFGIRARIVDFGPKKLESLFLSVPGTSVAPPKKKKSSLVRGPMDRYLVRNDTRKDDSGQTDSNSCGEPQSSGKNRFCNGGTSPNNPSDAQVLVDWVWNYFSHQGTKVSAQQQRVVMTGKAPLYFQHDGHSRTIVGIQCKQQHSYGSPEYTLLILDPAHRTEALERSIKTNGQWEKSIKRGVHTLKKSQYQICYIDPGIASIEEMELLKNLDSTYFEL
ncbi:unnamed protein product [Linum tenue]|uniref:UBZ4-type domain-containing protein n=1 Tax=Linum tenue TaxID=586396 RepID=A0AAV0Q7A1_9ROSI|nr:unnamed protein product [Linum tenue]